MLVGCTGGGGGGEPPSAPPPPACTGIETAGGECLTQDEFARRRQEIADAFLTDFEFRNQGALERIGAQEAYASLQAIQGQDAEPGAGTTVAVMDSSFVTGHPELAGGRISQTVLQRASADEEYSHGTAVASIIAANRDGRGFAGVAWGAEVAGFVIPLDDEEALQSFDWAGAFQTVLGSGADIVNMSYAASGTFVENYTADDLRRSRLGTEFAAMAQAGVADPMLFVRAAGNDHGQPCELGRGGVENCTPDPSSPSRGRYVATSPNVDAGGVALLEELQGHVVVVVGVDERGRIASNSNRCGIAGPWCIAAPGTDIRVAYADATRNVLGRGTGTSFAAPLVAGGLALMKQFFRGQLTNPDLLARLFATADKRGVYGNMHAYGQGLLDLGAAVAPVGPARVPAGSQVDHTGADVTTTALHLGSSFGDGLSQALTHHEMAAFDSLGAPFWFDLSQLAGAVDTLPMRLRLHDLLASDPGWEPGAGRAGRAAGASEGWRFGFMASPADAGRSLLGVARHAAALTWDGGRGLEAMAFTTAPGAGRGPADAGASLRWRPPGQAVGVRLGWLGERNRLLGSRAAGAFGRLAASSVVAGIEVGTALSSWDVEAGVEFGRVAPTATGGLLRGMSALSTSAFSLGAHRRLGRGRISLSLSQPPRVEAGSTRLAVPVGRTHEGVVLRRDLQAGLAPSGRQIDATARWYRPHVYGGEFRAEGSCRGTRVTSPRIRNSRCSRAG